MPTYGISKFEFSHLCVIGICDCGSGFRANNIDGGAFCKENGKGQKLDACCQQLQDLKSV